MRRNSGSRRGAPGPSGRGFRSRRIYASSCLRQANGAKSELDEAFPELSATMCGAHDIRGEQGLWTMESSRKVSLAERTPPTGRLSGRPDLTKPSRNRMWRTSWTNGSRLGWRSSMPHTHPLMSLYLCAAVIEVAGFLVMVPARRRQHVRHGGQRRFRRPQGILIGVSAIPCPWACCLGSRRAARTPSPAASVRLWESSWLVV